MWKRATCPEGHRFVAGDDTVATEDDTTCVPCPANAFKPGVSNATACTPQPLCAAGEHISTEDSAAMARSCESCASGTFEPKDDHRSTACSAWNVCGREGQFEAQSPILPKCGVSSF